MVIAAERSRTLAYWQREQMLARPSTPSQWVTRSGVYRIPERACGVSIQLRQAERKDDPQNGSAARLVARVLDRLHAAIDLPQTIVLDNGPEFAGRTLDAWAYRTGVTLRFIRPGTPIENAYVESFNGKFRDECLNEHWFVNLADAKTAIEALRIDYNTVRPHSSLDGATPHDCATTTEGARRLAPARLNEDLKTRGSLTIRVAEKGGRSMRCYWAILRRHAS